MADVRIQHAIQGKGASADRCTRRPNRHGVHQPLTGTAQVCAGRRQRRSGARLRRKQGVTRAGARVWVRPPEVRRCQASCSGPFDHDRPVAGRLDRASGSVAVAAGPAFARRPAGRLGRLADFADCVDRTCCASVKRSSLHMSGGNSLPKNTGPFARLPRCKKIQQPSGRNNGHYGNGGGRSCPYVASQHDINSKCCNLVGAFELC
jgi:hypothetical protein